MPHDRKRPHTENMNADASSFTCRFPPEGSDFGRYCNMRIIGEGGMGRVYLAFDPMLGIELAVKVLPRGIHSSKEEHRRFKREIQLLAAINIPGVVRLFDCGECDGWQYYTMEYVDGAAIDDYCDDRDLPQSERLALVVNLAETLAELHESDIIHRDLKPSNILVSDDGCVRLTDFGIAKSFDNASQQSAITLNDTRPGTPFYMSPESSSSLRNGDIAKKADVYSLGVVVFELLTGRLPYDVENLSATECVLVIREEEPHTFVQRDTPIAPGIEMVIMSTLEKDPDKRPDAKTLAAMLKQAIDGEKLFNPSQKASTRWPMVAAALVIGAFLVFLHALMINMREAKENQPEPDRGIVSTPTGAGTGADTTTTGNDDGTTGGNSTIEDGSDSAHSTDDPPPDNDPDPTPEPPDAQFKRILAQANVAMTNKQWGVAEAAFAELATIPGYETAVEAADGVINAKSGRMMEDAYVAARDKKWDRVRMLAEDVLKLKPSHIEASVLKSQAIAALIPKATITAWYNGREVKGAQVLVDDVPLVNPTPLTVELTVVDGKTVEIIAPRTPTTVYRPFQTLWKEMADNTLKAQLEAMTATLARDINMDMLPVSEGRFLMGRRNGGSRERPQHNVRISNDFWISKYEVSQDQYFVITRQNPSQDRGQNFPVVNVSWYEAVYFCKLLTAREKKTEQLPKGYVYRLPTEAEWEYACRAGTDTPYPFEAGATLPSRIAATESGLKHFAEVGYGKPNPWGLYNMNGNVREWVYDVYYTYGTLPAKDPVAKGRSSSRIVRGGSWQKPMSRCTSYYRDRTISGRKHFSDVGFRIVLAKPIN